MCQKSQRKNTPCKTICSAWCLLPMFTQEPYSLGRTPHLSSAGLLGLWVSTVALVPCISYFKFSLRSQVPLKGLIPKNMIASQAILEAERAKQEDAVVLPSGRL